MKYIFAQSTLTRVPHLEDYWKKTVLPDRNAQVLGKKYLESTNKYFLEMLGEVFSLTNGRILS